jgi:predicted Rossmann-fold nucleotide-binding protein
MKSICVFCDSSMASRPEYRQAAEDLGRLLLEQKIQLIYSGAKT